MDTASVIASIVMSPATDLEGYYWYDDQTLILTPDPLLFETNYTLTIFDEARDVYGHYMDGDQNGEEGGDFHLLFKTGPADMVPPEIENIFPPSVATNVEIFPIINIQFDETLDTSIDLLDYFLLERFQDHSSVSGDMVDNLLNGNQIKPMGSFEMFDINGNQIDEAVGEFNEHGNDSWAYDQRGFDYVMRAQFG